MIAINPEPVIGMPGTLIGIVRNPHHGDACGLPVNPDENCNRKGLVEFHKGQSRISCREFPSHQ
jgi:hypothetical protein